MVDSGDLVIAFGGGGIPVMRKGNHLKGASAVIDKDFASALLAKELDADFLIILTAVEKVALNYGKPDEKWLDDGRFGLILGIGLIDEQPQRFFH